MIRGADWGTGTGRGWVEGRTEVPETGSGGSAARPFLPQGLRGAGRPQDGEGDHGCHLLGV